jgi:hypothetical protein
MTFQDMHLCSAFPLSLYSAYEVCNVEVIDRDKGDGRTKLRILLMGEKFKVASLYMDRGVIWIGGEQAA